MFDQDFTPLLLSLKIAGISIVIVFVVGVSLARYLSRREFFGKNFLESLFLLPLVLPPTVVGFGLLVVFGKNGIIGSWLYEHGIQLIFDWKGAVVASTVVSFPLMYQSAQAAFKTLDDRLEKAALTMGASRIRMFFTVTLPLVWPGLLAGLILAFARALGEFGATLMLAGYIPGKTDTISLVIYFSVQQGKMEQATFWVVIIVALGLSAIMWLNWWTKRNLRRFEYEENK